MIHCKTKINSSLVSTLQIVCLVLPLFSLITCLSEQDLPGKPLLELEAGISSEIPAKLQNLLEGVTLIKFDGTPGDILVYGKNTYPILIDSSEKVLGAAFINEAQTILWYSHSSLFDPKLWDMADNRKLLSRSIQTVSSGGTVLFIETDDLIPLAEEIGIDCEKREFVPENLDQFSAVVINFRTFGNGVLTAQEVESLKDFLKGGGSLIGFGIGWVYNSYGEGKTGASLEECYPGNMVLSDYGALWGARYAMAEAFINENFRIGHYLTLIEKVWNCVLGKIELSSGESIQLLKSMAFYGSYYGIKQKPFNNSFSREEQIGMARFLLANSFITVPSAENPLSLSDTSSVMALYMAHQLFISNNMIEEDVIKTAEYRQFMDKLKCFPSYYLEDSLKESKQVSLEVSEKGRISTGYYALPGELVTIRSSLNNPPVAILVGSHTDNLFASNRKEWKRWPLLSSQYSFIGEEITFQSPFGGIIYFLPFLPKDFAEEIEFTLDGGTPYPFFKTRITTEKEWEEVLNKSPIPWVEIQSEKMVITTLASYAEGKDPQIISDFWDKVISLYPELSGHSEEGVSAGNRNRERIVFDEQTALGYMHSGYPIMAHMDHASTILEGALDPPQKGIEDSMWGFFHELGHNWQKRNFTMSYAGEVTVNLFTLYAMEKIYGIKALEHPMPYRTAFHKLESYYENPDPSRFKKEPFLGLYFFIYLIEDHGWEILKRVLRKFSTLVINPSTDEEKEQLWFRFYSEETEMDLTLYFKKWGFLKKSVE